MRFITEFTFDHGYGAPIPFKKNENESRLGHLIGDSFGWQSRGETAINGPIRERHTLEIEAFPMDKWLEFKKRFMDALPDYDTTSRVRLMNALEDLENFIPKTQLTDGTN